jgi:hypothetical protein
LSLHTCKQILLPNTYTDASANFAQKSVFSWTDMSANFAQKSVFSWTDMSANFAQKYVFSWTDMCANFLKRPFYVQVCDLFTCTSKVIIVFKVE